MVGWVLASLLQAAFPTQELGEVTFQGLFPPGLLQDPMMTEFSAWE